MANKKRSLLQQARLKKGLSQSQLAKMCNMSLSTLRQYEIEAVNISNANLKTLLKLCIALDCRLLDIVTDIHLRALLREYKEG